MKRGSFRLTSLVTFTVMLLLGAHPINQSYADEKGDFYVGPDGAKLAPRYALVIGVSSYAESIFRRLPNVENDLRAIKEALEKLGFEVYPKQGQDIIPLTRQKIKRLLYDHVQRVKKTGGASLIYFGGHGLTYQAKSYLVPYDAMVYYSRDIQEEFIPVDLLEEVAAGIDEDNKLKTYHIVILDACRNPALKELRHFLKGDMFPVMGGISLPGSDQLFLARSAGKDQEARDSLDGSANSPYADALLSVLKEPNLPITETFRKISLLFQPSNASLPKKDRQQPDYTTNAGGTFYFYPTITTYNEEKTQWDRINPDKGEGQYSAFLAGYPAGYFAANARQKTTLTEQLRKLARSATQVEVVPGSLRVREEPNGTVSGNVEKGAHLTALNYSTENPWVLVKKGDSQEGYVSSQFIKPVKTINKRVSLTYEPTSTAPPAQFGRFIRGLKPEDVHRIKVTAHADDESRVGKAVSRLIELQRSFQEIKVPSFKIEPLIKTFPTQGQVNRIDVVATVTSSVEQIMQAAPPKELKPR